MIFPSILLTLTFALVGTVQTLTWDCYDQKCEGDGSFSGTYIDCDNSINNCTTLYDGKNLFTNLNISTVNPNLLYSFVKGNVIYLVRTIRFIN